MKKFLTLFLGLLVFACNATDLPVFDDTGPDIETLSFDQFDADLSDAVTLNPVIEAPPLMESEHFYLFNIETVSENLESPATDNRRHTYAQKRYLPNQCHLPNKLHWKAGVGWQPGQGYII